ncbi:MAG: hypothetical protein ACXQTP_02315 [Candidatus Methanofastidiosia archaeon]
MSLGYYLDLFKNEIIYEQIDSLKQIEIDADKPFCYVVGEWSYLVNFWAQESILHRTAGGADLFDITPSQPKEVSTSPLLDNAIRVFPPVPESAVYAGAILCGESLQAWVEVRSGDNDTYVLSGDAFDGHCFLCFGLCIPFLLASQFEGGNIFTKANTIRRRIMGDDIEIISLDNIYVPAYCQVAVGGVAEKGIFFPEKCFHVESPIIQVFAENGKEINRLKKLVLR